MGEAPYTVVHIDEIPEPAHEKDPGEADWKPVRLHLGIKAFGTNAYVAMRADDQVVGEHTEVEDSVTRHEELYVVLSGRATFTIGGEDVEAHAGTLVYVRDPKTSRGAVAREDGTRVICFGGTPSEAFSVSPWERKYEAHAR